MNIVVPQEIDNRPIVYWDKKISTKYNVEFYTLAYYALRDSGKIASLNDMKEQLAACKKPSDTLKLIQRFVRIVIN